MLQQDANGYRLPFPVRYPVELHLPAGFRAEDGATWPRVEGRVEFVGGRLIYMPPCGDVQQDVAADGAFLLKSWSQAHPEYVVAGNEAGMILGGDVRAADLAVWRKSELGAHTGGFRRVPPVLAVEIAGQDESEVELKKKASWYLGVGVAICWIVLPQSREVLVVTSAGERRYQGGERLDEAPTLPGLSPEVAAFFTQLD